MKIKNVLVFLTLAPLFSGCSEQYAFSPITNKVSAQTPLPEPVLGSTFTRAHFNVEKTKEQFKQDDEYARNIINLQFQAFDATGALINNLGHDDVLINEGIAKVSNYLFDKTSQSSGRKADIVFVIDRTSSMDPFIDSTKLKVSDFVKELGKTNIKANLCLVLFGDSVDKACTKFVEDNPNTARNENLESFLDELSKVRTGGGDDTPENQLAALNTTASLTPWHTDAQRLAILITDASFHYAPDNIGDGRDVPTYEDTLNNISHNQMTTFLITPSGDGYSKDFKRRSPSLAKSSGGNWYDLDDVLEDSQNMTVIFNSIVDKLKTTYSITYSIEDNPGLTPDLTLDQRSVALGFSNPAVTGRFKLLSLSSTLPSGRPQYKKSFRVGSQLIDPFSLSVKLNGAPPSIGVKFQGNDLIFDQFPPPSSIIQVEYLYFHLKDNVKTSPIIVNSDHVPNQVSVQANGITVPQSDYQLRKLDQNPAGTTYVLQIGDRVLDDTDTYRVRVKGGLDLLIETH